MNSGSILPTDSVLDLPPLQALFPASERQIEGMVVTLYQNEKPLAGLAGWLDWYFRGAISTHLRSGFITGKFGECVYLPITQYGETYHLLLVGGGITSSPGRRGPIPTESLRALKKNLISLRLPKIGISRSDFEDDVHSGAFDPLFTHLRGLSLWIVQ